MFRLQIYNRSSLWLDGSWTQTRDPLVRRSPPCRHCVRVSAGPAQPNPKLLTRAFWFANTHFSKLCLTKTIKRSWSWLDNPHLLLRNNLSTSRVDRWSLQNWFPRNTEQSDAHSFFIRYPTNPILSEAYYVLNKDIFGVFWEISGETTVKELFLNVCIACHFTRKKNFGLCRYH